jgi:hypothetical protein
VLAARVLRVQAVSRELLPINDGGMVSSTIGGVVVSWTEVGKTDSVRRVVCLSASMLLVSGIVRRVPVRAQETGVVARDAWVRVPAPLKDETVFNGVTDAAFRDSVLMAALKDAERFPCRKSQPTSWARGRPPRKIPRSRQA